MPTTTRSRIDHEEDVQSVSQERSDPKTVERRGVLPGLPGAVESNELEVSDDVLDALLAGARTAQEIAGPDGLLGQLTRRLLNRALEAELSAHLGYEPGGAPPGGAGNARNGKPGKTILTDQGPLRIRSPRDRKGTFEPQIVKQRQTSRAAARRGTYEILAAQWPYSEGPIAARLNGTRNHIASATLDRVEWNNSTLITGNGTEHWQAPLRRRHDPCGREAHQQQGLQDRGH